MLPAAAARTLRGGHAAVGCSATATPRRAPGAALRTLVERDWQYQLERSPTYASVLGDRRFNDRWDDLSLAAIEADHRHTQQVLVQLGKLDRARLSHADQLTYDLFRRDHETWAEEYRFKLHLLPVDHMGSLPEGVRQPPGVQTAYQLADNLRFETVKDYEDWLVRLDRFGTSVDQVVALMRAGMAEGRIHPRVVLQRIPAQVEKQLVEDPTKSGFYTPFTRLPAGIPGADQRRLEATGRKAVAEGALPALRRFHQFLTREYIPAAPEQVGAWQLPEGDAMYAFLARRATTTSLTPEQVHQLGLSEVQRLRAEMERVKATAGFEGPLADFFRFLRTDPRLYFRTGEELLVHYRGLAKQIDPRPTRLFRALPRQPYGVEPTPEAMAPDVTTGLYYPAAADGSRPSRRACRTSAASAIPWPTARAGPSTARRSVTSLACTPTRTTASASSHSRCGARCGSWWTRACTPGVGRASRPSTPSSRTRHATCSTSPTRWTATSSCPARRWPTRWAS